MELVNVHFDAAGQLEAEMIKAFLRSQDMTVVLNQESVGRTLSLSAGYLGMVHVMVPKCKQKLPGHYCKICSSGEYETDEVLRSTRR